MRVLPHMDVIIPADAVETKQVIHTMKDHDDNPAYVRLARAPFPVVFDDCYRFEFGKAKVLREGSDISLFACGLPVAQSLEAAKILSKRGISAEVVNASTIKPIDMETIVNSVSKTQAAVTAEEHQVAGGLGSADDLIKHYGLTPEGIAQVALRVLQRMEHGDA